jgi:hypothetical protein
MFLLVSRYLVPYIRSSSVQIPLRTKNTTLTQLLSTVVEFTKMSSGLGLVENGLTINSGPTSLLRWQWRRSCLTRNMRLVR